jgi:hypothetical protein
MVVKSPKMIDRVWALRNKAISISSPAENISSNFPSSAKKSAIGRCSPKKPSTCGPKITPKSSSPTIGGSPMRPASRGTPTMAAMITANFARSGSARTCDLIASSKFITSAPSRSH